MFNTAKILLFGLFALAVLVVGCLGAQFVWNATHHRYDSPDSGYYHGVVHALFSGTDEDVYSFRFRGRSEPRWQWTYSTNFIYHSLQFEWISFAAQADSVKGSGTLQLPSFDYESAHGTGVLTREVLSQWLIGTNHTPEAVRGVEAIFSFIEDAGRGTLPAPNHHGYYFEQPVSGHIQHYRLGRGVGEIVYIWGGIWLFLVVFFGRRFWRRHREG